MIKSILKFISGEVIKTNQTNKTVYLSDNTHWNSSKFHEYCQLIRAFINTTAQQSEEITSIQEEINCTIQAYKTKMHSKAYFYSRINQVLLFGKYKNKTVAEVALIDVKYLDWYFDNMPNDFLLEGF